MQTISYVIGNAGDGSNFIQWFNRALTEQEQEALEESDFEAYSSGDGLQYNTMSFPDEFSISGWAGVNYITLEEFKLDSED